MDVFEKNDIGIFKKVVKLSRHDALMKIENETLNKLGDIISFFFTLFIIGITDSYIDKKGTTKEMKQWVK